MRVWAVSVLSATLLTAVGHPFLLSQTSSTDSTIAALVGKWDKRDGAAFIEVGSQLSEQFVLHGTSFFRVMKKHPKSFQSWIDELPSSTFTVYDYKDSADSVHLRSESVKLRSDMIARAKELSQSPGFSKMAKRLTAALKKVQIRFTD